MSLWSFIGYEALVVAAVVAFAAAHWTGSRRASGGDLHHRFIFILVFFGFALALFLHVRRVLFHMYGGGQASISFERVVELEFQYALALVAVGIVLQVIVIQYLSTSFSRMVVPALVNVVVWGGVFFLDGTGIINLVWMCVFTGVQSGFIVVAIIFDDLDQVLEDGQLPEESADRWEVLGMIRQDANGLLKMGFSGFLALGASVGVSMSILFGGGEVAWQDGGNQVNAARLVVGFGLVAIASGIWIAKPYLECTERLRQQFRAAGR